MDVIKNVIKLDQVVGINVNKSVISVKIVKILLVKPRSWSNVNADIEGNKFYVVLLRIAQGKKYWFPAIKSVRTWRDLTSSIRINKSITQTPWCNSRLRTLYIYKNCRLVYKNLFSNLRNTLLKLILNSWAITKRKLSFTICLKTTTTWIHISIAIWRKLHSLWCKHKTQWFQSLA